MSPLVLVELLEKERKKHIVGFSLECFHVEKINDKKKLEKSLLLQLTSEVLLHGKNYQILKYVILTEMGIYIYIKVSWT